MKIKEIGTVGYVANSPYTKATGTMSAGRIYEKEGMKFWVEVMFITSSKIICKVLEDKKKLIVHDKNKEANNKNHTINT